MSFIHDDFLLETKAARRLFHTYAAPQPIIDYHCHLPPKDVAEDRRFAQPLRDLARRRSLQVACDARQRRRRAVLHRRRRPAREIPGLGEDGAAVPAQSALSLDAPRAEALLRHRRAAGREDGRQRLGAGERGADSHRSSARRASSASSASRPSARPTIRRIR